MAGGTSLATGVLATFGAVTGAAGFAGGSVTLDKAESYLARIADRLDKMEALPSGEQQRTVITPYGAVQVSSTSEY